jgi:hypothetical protein
MEMNTRNYLNLHLDTNSRKETALLLLFCIAVYGYQKNILRDDFGLGSFMTNVVPGIENPCIWRKLLHSSTTRIRRSPYKYDAT